MHPISILFFALASMIGKEDSSIVSRKVRVTINPTEKNFEIIQEDLFSIVKFPEDSIMVVNELQYIMEFDNNTEHQDTNALVVQELTLSRIDQQLNATLKGRYLGTEILADAGISYDSTKAGEFFMMNIPEWNIHSTDAILKEDYWVWSADKPVTIVIEPFTNIPEEYLMYKRSVLPFWERSKQLKPNNR